jgi:hypothetical protein
MDFSVVPRKIEEVMNKKEEGDAYYSVCLGYDPSYIGSIIDGLESPTLEFLEKFAEITNTELEFLFGMVTYITDVEF